MKSCDENQNLMSTLLPLKNCPCDAYSGIENFNTEGRISSLLSMISLINHDFIMK